MKTFRMIIRWNNDLSAHKQFSEINANIPAMIIKTKEPSRDYWISVPRFVNILA